MTKKLEELLELPDNKDLVDSAKTESSKKEKAIAQQEDDIRSIEELDKIASALPAVKGLGTRGDQELNEIADKALQAYEDLMDLGMNVESRYSGRVFEVAGGMLKTGLDARTAKLDKKIKMIELQLKKEKLDKDSNPDDGGFVAGEGHLITDRNSLMERLKGMDKDK